MNLEKLKDSARKYELKEDWRAAIGAYRRAIDALEAGGGVATDLTLYNRLGDLYLRVSEPADAVSAYERAAELYAEQGFVNNAIALCGKILRVSPGRVQTYLQLAQFHARKNVVFETKRNLLEFLERMLAAQQFVEGVGALEQFARQFSRNHEIREMLADLIRAASADPKMASEKTRLSSLADELDAGGQGGDEGHMGGSGLVFLDTGVHAVPPVEGLQRPDEGADEVESIEIETGRADEAASTLDPDAATPLSGLETTAVDVELDEGTGESPPFDGLLVADTLGSDADDAEPAAEPLGLEHAVEGPIDLDAAPDDTGFERGTPSDAEGLWPTPDTGLVSDLTLQPEGPPPSVPTPAIAVGPTLAELERAVSTEPANPAARRRLGEALLAAGEAARGREELEEALRLHEAEGDWGHAGDVLGELIRLAPADIRYYQKRVELAFRGGDRGRLLDAYLELADCLVRTGALDKAEAVYRRILEHEPGHARARAALEAVASGPAAPAPGAPAAHPAAPPAGGWRPPVPPAETGYVDLGAMLLDPEPGRADTRIRVEDEEPTGDEEADFEQILQQFKQGLERSLTEDDFQTHYDLGIAFKEMGLLDEAIAEFQKALRAPEGRLRTAEALGTCFFETGQFAVASAILRRAVDTIAGGDEEKIGLLYWLGRADEAQSRHESAVETYERALAVDIGFRDVHDRLRALSGGAAS